MNFLKWFKWYRVLGLAVIFAMTVSVTACSKTGQEESGAMDETSGAMEAAQDYVSDQRKEAVEALQSAYDEFSEKFEGFRTRNAYVFTEAKQTLENTIEEKMAEIEKQLVEARSAAEETWEQIKADVTGTMEELEQAMVDFES